MHNHILFVCLFLIFSNCKINDCIPIVVEAGIRHKCLNTDPLIQSDLIIIIIISFEHN